MISELSESGQYICTTFRPELIPHADAYFGVIFNATKISNVKKRESFYSTSARRTCSVGSTFGDRG